MSCASIETHTLLSSSPVPMLAMRVSRRRSIWLPRSRTSMCSTVLTMKRLN